MAAKMNKFLIDTCFCHCTYTANNYCEITAKLRCYVSHTSLTVLRAADGSTEYCQTRAVVSSAALSTAKLVWET